MADELMRPTTDRPEPILRFQNKVAVITGGGIGFGRRFARRLADEGAMIAVFDVDAPLTEQLIQALTDQGVRCVGVACDVSDEQAVGEAVQRTTDEFGGVDILINNAGRHFRRYGRPVGQLTDKELRELFDVNVFGAIYCSLAVQLSMRERGGGAIVNITSSGGHRVNTAYGLSKLGLRGLTMSFAYEMAADGIRVNAVSPGLMATENSLLEYEPEHFERAIANAQLIKRTGTMDDVANAVLFLASDEASFITGQTLVVDGGKDIVI
jgi:NAD(P)-dependent dehydrogenase (short-subunit alcohol dehydrogenase family)